MAIHVFYDSMYLWKASRSVDPWSRWRCSPNIPTSQHLLQNHRRDARFRSSPKVQRCERESRFFRNFGGNLKFSTFQAFEWSWSTSFDYDVTVHVISEPFMSPTDILAGMWQRDDVIEMWVMTYRMCIIFQLNLFRLISTRSPSNRRQGNLAHGRSVGAGAMLLTSNDKL